MTDTITWAAGSNGATMTTVGATTVVTPDGVSSDPSVYSSLVGPLVPNTAYVLFPDLEVTEDRDVAVFVAFFGNSDPPVYSGSGIYPAAQLLNAGAPTPTDLVFVTPPDGSGTFVQAIVQLSSIPPATAILTVTSAEVSAVPKPAGTVATVSSLNSGVAEVTFSDNWSFLTVLNLDPSEFMTVTSDGSAAVVGQDDAAAVIPPASLAVVSNQLAWWAPGYLDPSGNPVPNPGAVISLASNSAGAGYSVMAAA